MKKEIINEEFNKMEKIMYRFYGKVNLKSLKESFIREKQCLFPLFKEDGRIESSIMNNETSLSKSSVIKSFSDIIIEVNEKAASTGKPAYDHINLNKFTNILLEIFTVEEFIQNKVITTQGYNKGMKLTKTFPTIKTLHKLEVDLNQYMLLLSMLKQNLTANNECKVVVSINPFDLFTVSDFTTNAWRSCHNWIDGEYAAGACSYMGDPSSCVGYVYTKGADSKCTHSDNNKTKIESEFYGTPIKIWRQMIYIDVKNKGALFSRHYVNFNEIYEFNTRSLVGNAIAEYYDIAPKWVKKKYNDDIFTKDVEGDQYHGDPLTNMIIFDKNIKYHVDIGHEFDCLKCGCSADNSHLICCTSSRKRCVHCNGWHDDDDMYSINDNWVCEDCFDILYLRCDKCGEYFYKESEYAEFEGNLYCYSCKDAYLDYCENCDEYTDGGTKYVKGIGHVCNNCLKQYDRCTMCNDYSREGKIYKDKFYCKECIDTRFITCDCNKSILPLDGIFVGKKLYCKDCIKVEGKI